MVGLSLEDVLRGLYARLGDWIADVKELARKRGKDVRQLLVEAHNSRRMRPDIDGTDKTANALWARGRAGPDLLRFFIERCPHVREDLLRGELPPYPWQGNAAEDVKADLAIEQGEHAGGSGSSPAQGRKAAEAAPPENGNRRRNKCTTSLPKRGKRLSPTPRTDGYELFYSFSTKDESLRIQLETHLAMLKREKLIREWHFQKIPPGTAFRDEIDKHLTTARIILLLVSADFLASDYCYTIEMKRAIERHKKGSAVVIPIILRECDWDKAPFADLEALPKNAKPVTSWRDKDKAFTDIAKGIRRTIESLKSQV